MAVIERARCGATQRATSAPLICQCVRDNCECVVRSTYAPIELAQLHSRATEYQNNADKPELIQPRRNVVVVVVVEPQSLYNRWKKLPEKNHMPRRSRAA